MGTNVENESIRKAMDEAWRDHQHTRDQTWKALQAEFALAVAVVGAVWKTESTVVIIGAAVLVFVISLCCIQISLRHRNSVATDEVPTHFELRRGTWSSPEQSDLRR